GRADVIESISEAKEKLSKNDEQSRSVMGVLYDINTKMKRMSRKRDILTNRLIDVQGNVSALEISTKQLDELITMQRSVLSKKLRTMYMIGEESVVRAIFSSSSSHDLEKLLKYLRRVSNQDYRVIKSYEKNLSLLMKKKKALDIELRKLASLKNKIKTQEGILEDNQKSKSKLLSQLEDHRKNTIKEIKGLRAKAERTSQSADLRSSFFEKKGDLSWPVEAEMIRNYGLIENPKYKYRLAHKGISLNSQPGQPIRAIHDGVVSFIGDVSGYGKTIIIDHDDHFYSVYSNLKEVLFTKGQPIRSQQVLANSSGNIYFEIRHFSDALDPLQWLYIKGKTL
ncbi:MAG: peptidoglycan DD-metalloendopeptidase family protein, partial [Bdellovibrionota bacterium]